MSLQTISWGLTANKFFFFYNYNILLDFFSRMIFSNPRIPFFSLNVWCISSSLFIRRTTSTFILCPSTKYVTCVDSRISRIPQVYFGFFNVQTSMSYNKVENTYHLSILALSCKFMSGYNFFQWQGASRINTVFDRPIYFETLADI